MLTGFLGAGKTTLLNRLIADPSCGPVAVVVNEFGELGVDGRLVMGTREDLVEVRDGCVCCTVRGDLVRGLHELLDRREAWWRRVKFSRILLETSGLASPGPVLQSFRADPRLRAETRVDGTLTVVNLAAPVSQLDEHPELAAQIALADVLVEGHGDRATVEGATAWRETMTVLNQHAPRVTARDAVAPLLEIGADQPRRWRFESIAPGAAAAALSLTPDLTPAHTPGLQSLSFTADVPVDIHALKLFLQFAAQGPAWRMLRIKGIVCGREQRRPVVVQGLEGVLELGPGEGPPPERSVVVVIGVGVAHPALRAAWDRLLLHQPGA